MTTRRRRTVTKKAHAAGTRTSLADRQELRGTTVATGSAAMGPRPDPGPVPQAAETAGADTRHQPIRWAFPWAANQVWTPRRHALTPFATLRNLADVSDLTRTCIETRKDQMTSLGYDIAPIDVRQGKRQSEQIERQIAQARGFFRKPDLRRPFSTWMRMALEEVLVIDALSIYRRPTRGRAAGVEGYKTACLEIKDGTTFLPLLDESGDTPLPPSVAYRQVIHGVPMAGGDCTIQELYYRPRTVRAHTPYGLSPTEAVLLTINAALNRQMFNLAYYTDGNVPEGLLEAPIGFTTQQLTEFQQFLDDYLSGDHGRRRRMKVIHGGAKIHQFKDPDFTGAYDEWLLKVHCAAFAVPPQEIGFTSDVNRATGEQQENVSYRRGVKPMGQFFKDLFDEVLAEDLGFPGLQWVWVGGEQEDKKLQAEVDAIYVRLGKTSVDELRQRDGQPAIGLGPYIDTAMGPLFVEDLLAEPLDDDPDTSEARTPDAAEGEPRVSGKESGVSGKDPDAEKLSAAAVADLKVWRANAIKAAKAEKPVRAFASEHIPIDLHARIERFLARAGADVAKVVAAFELAIDEQRHVAKAGERRRLTRIEQKAAKAYQRVTKASFATQRKALLAHIAKELAP